MALLASIPDSGPLTAKLITAWLSKQHDRAVNDRQVRGALYALADRGLVELQIQANPFGRPGICVYLPGELARFEAAYGRHPGDRPVRPPKPEPRTMAGEFKRLADAARAFAYVGEDDEDEMLDRFLELAAVAQDFKPPLSG